MDAVLLMGYSLSDLLRRHVLVFILLVAENETDAVTTSQPPQRNGANRCPDGATLLVDLGLRR